MSLRMECPHCHRMLNVTSEAFGTTAPCPGCGGSISFPSQPETLEQIVPTPPPLPAAMPLGVSGVDLSNVLQSPWAQRAKNAASQFADWIRSLFGRAKGQYHLILLQREVKGLEAAIQSQMIAIGADKIARGERLLGAEAETRRLQDLQQQRRHCEERLQVLQGTTGTEALVRDLRRDIERIDVDRTSVLSCIGRKAYEGNQVGDEVARKIKDLETILTDRRAAMEASPGQPNSRGATSPTAPAAVGTTIWPSPLASFGKLFDSRRRLIVAGAAIVLVLLASVWLLGDNSVSATRLSADWRNDEKAFLASYGRKTLTLTGRVLEPYTGYESFGIVLETSGKPGVRCKFREPSESTSKFAELLPGDWVKIRGKCQSFDGHNNENWIDIDGCVLLSSKTEWTPIPDEKERASRSIVLLLVALGLVVSWGSYRFILAPLLFKRGK